MCCEACSGRRKRKYSSLYPLKITYYNFSGWVLVGCVDLFFFFAFRKAMEAITSPAEVRKT